MIQFYDINPIHPYLCLKNIDESNLRAYIDFLHKNSIIVNKLYEKPKYPASNGITYEYLLRINYLDPIKRLKPEREKVEFLFQDFIAPKPAQKVNTDQIKLFEEEKKYFKQIKAHLNSERKSIEIERQFLKDQLTLINKISDNLKSENDRVFKLIENHNETVTSEIKKIATTKTIDENTRKLLEQISKKESLLKEKEIEYERKNSELDEEKAKLIEYKSHLEQEKIDYVNELRDISLGVIAHSEDSIQDLRILIFGESKVSAHEIFEIFNSTFSSTFNEELDKKCVEAVYLNYKDAKNSNINKKIKADRYDYIVVGPHDHSTKGKSSKQSYLSFIKENNLKAMINAQNDSALSSEIFKELAERFINHWESQFVIDN